MHLKISPIETDTNLSEISLIYSTIHVIEIFNGYSLFFNENILIPLKRVESKLNKKLSICVVEFF